MAGHRAVPKRRADPRSARHGRPQPKRRAVRPRYGRLVAASAAVLVTGAAVLAGTGLLPVDNVQRPANAQAAAGAPVVPEQLVKAADQQARVIEGEKVQAEAHATRSAQSLDLPAKSGEGRRAVFDMSSQRVWIVGSDNRVERTYLVSGSVTGNLDPGTYAVYSRSRNAVGIEDSGTMEFFVRFARGDNAAIGFHNIPVKDGEPLQTAAQLGTPQSHGCIRQAQADAIAMWDFAQIGTTVVVTA